MKIYIVCEGWTNEFWGVYTNRKEAEDQAKFICGNVRAFEVKEGADPEELKEERVSYT